MHQRYLCSPLTRVKGMITLTQVKVVSKPMSKVLQYLWFVCQRQWSNFDYTFDANQRWSKPIFHVAQWPVNWQTDQQLTEWTTEWPDISLTQNWPTAQQSNQTTDRPDNWLTSQLTDQSADQPVKIIAPKKNWQQKFVQLCPLNIHHMTTSILK